MFLYQKTFCIFDFYILKLDLISCHDQLNEAHAFVFYLTITQVCTYLYFACSSQKA